MNRVCTIVSMALGAASFAYMFNSDPSISCRIGIAVLVLVSVAFWVASKATYYWNTKLNRIVYYLSKNNREYNYETKEFTYTCIGENEYKSTKELIIYPTCNNLDRVVERFSWSAPSGKAKITPLVSDHEITALRQQELWTYYSVFFHHTCQRGKTYRTGSIIDNLIDENNEAVPFISATIDRKTKRLVMRVCFENRKAPNNAVFKVFTHRNNSEEIYSEEIAYDDAVKGFSKQVDFPRQNWKYVISWNND